ncbi:MAG: hypothetical protein ACN6OP_08050 [Pseudomonadales bacterium]
MVTNDSEPNHVRRSFQDIVDDGGYHLEQASVYARMGLRSSIEWEQLLLSPRVLIVSEAGAGKTYECRAQHAARWAAGEPAFFFELATLSNTPVNDLLDAEEQKRFDAWRKSQSDVATIFLDSIDELKLTLGSFEQALKRLSRELSGQLGRVKLVITTRPIPLDLALIKKHLSVPAKGELIASEQAFADVAMGADRNQRNTDHSAPDWRHVTLLPLSLGQIREMAGLHGIRDVDTLLEDVRNHHAEDFIGRPQDLIELFADWRDYHRIRTHREQISHNISIKLRPRTDRREKTPLSEDRALQGARRLAFAALMTRKLTLRHSAEADRGGEAGSALDPASILSDWTADERQTLLERALFGFSNYGRVRFHHRSVIEYLAASWLDDMLNRGMSIKSAKRLLFTQTLQSTRIVKPSLRPVAAWLALSQSSIFKEVRDREPEVLLSHADPESLSPEQRIIALRDYVERHGHLKWQGLRIPQVQAHRFASKEIGIEVLRLWHGGVINPEVRDLLLTILAAAPIEDAADLAYSVATSSSGDIGERLCALDVLVRLNEPRIDSVTQSMEAQPNLWPSGLLRSSIPALFPKHVTAERLCRILEHIDDPQRGVDLLNHLWVPLIVELPIESEYLEVLREGLTSLVAEGVEWRKEWPHAVSPRPYLLPALAAVCHRHILGGNFSVAVINSCVRVLRLVSTGDAYSDDESIKKLRQAFETAPANIRELAFWTDDSFCHECNQQTDAWRRFFEISSYGTVSLSAEKDRTWILHSLSDQTRPADERAVLLEAAMQTLASGQGAFDDHLRSLKEYVADLPELIATLDARLQPSPASRTNAQIELRHRKQAEEARRRRDKDHASWIEFWRTVATNPDTAFSPDQAGRTAWNLWQAMNRSGDESRSSGWNRRFIEKYFSKDIADRLRVVMKSIWRKDRPTLRSEREHEKEDTFLIRWQFGLAAIAAEAEDPQWALQLSVEEAELATRYVPLEFSAFPSWLDSLCIAHPNTVERVLGPELTSELDRLATPHTHFQILQNIGYASQTVAKLFLPRLDAWFEAKYQHAPKDENTTWAASRLRRVMALLLKYGGPQAAQRLSDVSIEQLKQGLDGGLAQAWMPFIFQLNPEKGADILDQEFRGITPSVESEAVSWIGTLFGDRHNESLVTLQSPGFTPPVLLHLVRLAYRHVRPEEDRHHEGVFTPCLRDHGEQGRNALLSALLSTQGQAGWQAKLEMANDPLFNHFQHRAMHIAREKAAEEADGYALPLSAVVDIVRYREASPSTREEMFELLCDRLDDIDDLLLQDDSPREAWATISDEKLMRREIARVLRIASNNAYRVDQEAVTADEKETDIRLHATASGLQAVIELKLAGNRSGRDLRDTLEQQLVTKYMAPDSCRAGCLLVTVNATRRWEHPDTGVKIDVNGLEMLLQQEAARIEAKLQGQLRVTARVLDLRPRLPPE